MKLIPIIIIVINVIPKAIANKTPDTKFDILCKSLWSNVTALSSANPKKFFALENILSSVFVLSLIVEPPTVVGVLDVPPPELLEPPDDELPDPPIVIFPVPPEPPIVTPPELPEPPDDEPPELPDLHFPYFLVHFLLLIQLDLSYLIILLIYFVASYLKLMYFLLHFQVYY